ncbi:monocarboxylate transporter 12 [Trichonephila inaurata madagascariensis]|uniref:Monocarboxylate transporter 12 n=1 Tax=Trichonephila inaurata madagascariensis TaxID=2747483 RepID=A0A8X6XCI2_9ARAC|nr:monocarboxylate transporter 12 [Trichonephila inaurata madagascariensis]
MPSSSSAPPPDPNIDGGWGWAVVFSTFTVRFIMHGFFLCSGIYYVEFREYFNTTSGAASLVMSILLGTTNIIGPIASALVTKYSCRTVSITGSVISCIGLLLSLAAPCIEYLYLTLGLITGFGFGLVFLPTITSVAMHFEKKRATAMGISSAGSGMGALFLVPFTEWLINYYNGWKGALLITSGIVMHCLVLSLFYCKKYAFVRRNEPVENSSDQPESDSSPNSPDSLESNKKKDNKHNIRSVSETDMKSYNPASISELNIMRSATRLETLPPVVGKKNRCLRFSRNLCKMLGFSLLKDHVFLVFSLSRLLQYFGAMIPNLYLYHQATELGIATSLQASLLISILGLSNTAGKILFGIFADLTSSNVLYTYIICLLINGIATMVTSFLTNYYMMAIYSFVFGLTFGATINLTSILSVKLFGLEKISNVSGLIFLFTGFAIAIGSPVAGE